MRRGFTRVNTDWRILVIVFILSIAMITSVHAEGITVNAGVDRTEITVGDPIMYVVHVTADERTEIDVPHLPAAWGDFHVLSQQPLAGDNVPPVAEQTATGRLYTITAYRVGEFATPPLTVRYQETGGEWQEYIAAPISITVVSVLTATEGTTETVQLRGLKSPANMAPDYRLWVGYALLAVSLALFAWWAYNYWQRRQRVEKFVPEKVVDPRPPYVIAYEKLARVEAEKLPEQGMFRAHYTRVSDCMREYAERIYDVPALDRTTEEFLGAMRRAKVNRNHWAMFHRLLEESDLVKFAKYKPPIAAARNALERARLIVDVTKPAEENVKREE